jgi:UDP-2,4-diacetamido-2,4,6-trideoxy-beta-L-altropyranose hydrolase
MKVVFRVDASAQIGIGHFMRCLTLAESLSERGLQLRFICREHAGNLIALLQQKAIPVTVLTAPIVNDTPASDDYAAWLGATQAEDAEQTIEALNGQKPDWLVVDHYGLGVEWEQGLRPHVNNLLVIDDLANRRHDCDVLLDQNYAAKSEQRYAGLVSETCITLLGPRYALLRPEYRAYRKTMGTRDGHVKRVLVFFGGTDPQNLTGMALKALSQPELKHLRVDVVVGANNPHRKSIEQQVLHRQHATMYESRPHLADLMAQADIALGAGGATTWERMCLGLPTVVVAIAENQIPAAEALAAKQLILYAGKTLAVSANNLSKEITALISNASQLIALSEQNKLMVDGFGAMRIREVMQPTDIANIRLRVACPEDVVTYFSWANDSEVRKNAIQTALISWVTHKEWFTERLKDSSNQMYVMEAAGLPVGQIRFEREEGEARIDYSLDTDVRSRDWASRMIALGANLMQESKPVRLRVDVKDGNEASSAVFLRMGFTETTSTSEGGVRSIAILSDRLSWINNYIQELLLDWLAAGHRVLWVHDKQDLRPGDFCFYLSCGQIVHTDTLSQFQHNLVVHESDLPRGKGWSPLTWQILEGKNSIPVTLFEATEKVDSGVIYAQEWMEFEGHELLDELREVQAKLTIKLCKQFAENYPQILDKARKQAGEGNFYRRRREADSELDCMQSIGAQFDKLRVVDNHRYPAFFVYRNHRYLLKFKKLMDS